METGCEAAVAVVEEPNIDGEEDSRADRDSAKDILLLSGLNDARVYTLGALGKRPKPSNGRKGDLSLTQASRVYFAEEMRALSSVEPIDRMHQMKLLAPLKNLYIAIEGPWKKS